MASTEELTRGAVIRHEGRLYRVEDYHVAQAGQQRPRVHVKLRTLDGGHATERLLDQMGRIEEVESEVRAMQYLYASGRDRVFMDNETFEQLSLSEDVVGPARDFLVENDDYKVLLVEGRPVEIQLPAHAVMAVAETAPVEHAGGASNVHKDATLASGLTIQVPLFIATGELVRVDTATKQYLGKERGA